MTRALGGVHFAEVAVVAREDRNYPTAPPHRDENHEHVYSKESCGWLEWVNAAGLADTYESVPELDEEGDEIWPEGPISFVWDGDCVIWSYAPEPAALAVS